MQGLAVGRMVHYVLSGGRSAGQVRPAIVVRNWDDEALSYPPGTCNLHVFLDGANDTGSECEATSGWIGSVHFDETEAQTGRGYKPGTWHWPPRV